jgi:Arc/MetJ family transcription regulator
MAVTSIDIQGDLLERARNITGSRSNREVVDLALRRLIASKVKKQMVEGIATLTEMPEGLDAPRVDPETGVPRT